MQNYQEKLSLVSNCIISNCIRIWIS